ncbi:hypothetical protein MMC13_006194 [Lambiella insularis]|nr:hypothetical protein [Lambiella insularis]
MPPPSPSKRPPLRYEQNSSGSLNGLEQYIAPQSVSAESPKFLTPDTLNRPLPPIPMVRRSSSLYSCQHEDIIDMYANRDTYIEPLSPVPPASRADILAPTSFSPSSIQQFLRHQSNANGSFSMPPSAAYDEPNYPIQDTLAGSRDKPEWTLQSSRTRSHRSNIQHSQLSDVGSQSARSPYSKSLADSASVSSSIRPVSPKSRLRSPEIAYPPSFRSTSRPTSPRTRLGSPMAIYADSAQSSVRSVSPMSQPWSRWADTGEHARRKRQEPPAPITVRSYHKASVEIERSPIPSDASNVPYQNEHEFPDTPLSARITQLVDHTLVPTPLRASRVPSAVSYISADSRPSHDSVPFTIITEASASKTPMAPSGRPTYLNWPEVPYTRPKSPTYSISPPSPTSPSRRPSLLSWPKAPTSRRRSSTHAPAHEGQNLRQTMFPSPSIQEPEDELSKLSIKYSSTKPAPPRSRHSRGTSSGSGPKSAISDNIADTIYDTVTDVYDTIASISIPKPSFSLPKRSNSAIPKHQSNPDSQSSSNPLIRSFSLSRDRHKRHPSAPSPKTPSTPRLINRKPAIPMTEYQYMGPKAWEEAPSPKGKPRRTSKGQSPKDRISSIFGGMMKGKDDKKEEEQEKRRAELKKKIVFVGLEGERKDLNRAVEGDWL